jgi:dihydrofolate reductase
LSRVVYNTASSFNGFIATSDNSLEWLFSVGSADETDIASFFEGVDVLVSGSTTFEWLVENENLIEEPDKWKKMYGDRPYFVFSSRDLTIPEGIDVRLLQGPVGEHLELIRGSTDGGDIWVIGGGDLAAQFLDEGALDEIQVTMTPVALADGAPLFPREMLSDKLELESVEKFGQFAHLTFRVR